MATKVFLPKFREPVNIVFRVLVAVAGVPAQAQGIDVPQGASVFVRAHNGKVAGNAGPVVIGRDPETVRDYPAVPASIHARTIAPNTQVPYPVSNTRDLYVCGNVDDGIEVSIVG